MTSTETQYRITYSTPYSVSKGVEDYETGWSADIAKLESIVDGEWGRTVRIDARQVDYSDPVVWKVFDHTHAWQTYVPSGIVGCWCGARPVLGVDLVVPD